MTTVTVPTTPSGVRPSLSAKRFRCTVTHKMPFLNDLTIRTDASVHQARGYATIYPLLKCWTLSTDLGRRGATVAMLCLVWQADEALYYKVIVSPASPWIRHCTGAATYDHLKSSMCVCKTRMSAVKATRLNRYVGRYSLLSGRNVRRPDRQTDGRMLDCYITLSARRGPWKQEAAQNLFALCLPGYHANMNTVYRPLQTCLLYTVEEWE